MIATRDIFSLMFLILGSSQVDKCEGRNKDHSSNGAAEVKGSGDFDIQRHRVSRRAWPSLVSVLRRGSWFRSENDKNGGLLLLLKRIHHPVGGSAPPSATLPSAIIRSLWEPRTPVSH